MVIAFPAPSRDAPWRVRRCKCPPSLPNPFADATCRVPTTFMSIAFPAPGMDAPRRVRRYTRPPAPTHPLADATCRVPTTFMAIAFPAPSRDAPRRVRRNKCPPASPPACTDPIRLLTRRVASLHIYGNRLSSPRASAGTPARQPTNRATVNVALPLAEAGL